jgi:hypothetical protein
MDKNNLRNVLEKLTMKDLRQICKYGNRRNSTASIYYHYTDHKRKADLVNFLVDAIMGDGRDFELLHLPYYNTGRYFYYIQFKKE